MALEQFANNAQTTLNGAITAGATSLTVQSAAGFPSSPLFRIVIDSELMLVTAVSGTTWTVTRGIEGTTAASHSSGATVIQMVTAGAVTNLGASQNPNLCQGRLTLTSGTPVTTADVTGGTLYFTPYVGNRIALFDGTQWKLYAFSEVSLALSVTAGVNYDAFLYDNGGTLTLELTAWTNNTTRATALMRQDGVYVRSDNATRRYLGTIRAAAANTGADTAAQRFVWNMVNRVARKLLHAETTSNWSYTFTTIRQANGNSANKVEVVRGMDEDVVHLAVSVDIYNTTNPVNVLAGVGVDSTTVNSAGVFGGACPAAGFGTAKAFYDDCPGLGYHALNWLEASDAAGMTYWYGTNTGGLEKSSGMAGLCWA